MSGFVLLKLSEEKEFRNYTVTLYETLFLASEQSMAAPNLMELMTGQTVDSTVVSQLLAANELTQSDQQASLQPILLSTVTSTSTKAKPGKS